MTQDVDSYEMYVLMGLGESMNNASIVYFEVMDARFHAAGYSFRDIHSLLTDRRLEIFAVNCDRMRAVYQEEIFPVCHSRFATLDSEFLCRRLGAYHEA